MSGSEKGGFRMRRIIAQLMTLVALSLHAGGQTPAGGEQVVRLRTDLVRVDVLPVRKETGRPLAGMGREDFAVFEDGVAQTITHFSQDQLPASVLLLVDRAGCVNPFDEQIRAATIEALRRLKPEDEVAVMTFAKKVSLRQPFTRDRAAIAAQINAVEPQHESEQHYFNAAIYEAANYMSRAANPAGRRAIIVLTSLEASVDFSRTSADEALQALLESGAVVSGVLVQSLGGRIEQGIRGKPTSILRHIGLRAGSLKMFVDETGGELVGAPPGRIEATLTRLAANLSASYSLAYTPTNSARGGGRRRIRVRLSPEAEQREGKAVVLARRSYVIPDGAGAGGGAGR